MALSLVRNGLRPRRFSPGKLSTLPQRSGGCLSHDAARRDRPLARTLTVATDDDDSGLTREQLKELFAGRFPADYLDEVIHLSKIPKRDHRESSTRLTPPKMITHKRYDRDDRWPLGHVLFDRHFSRTSVYSAPIPVNDAAVQSIIASIWGVIIAKVPDYLQKFRLQTNSVQLRASDFTTKIPDVMISHLREGPKPSTPFFLAEVGFSESYPDLVKSMKHHWLQENQKVRVAFLVKFNEYPRYNGKKCLNALPKEIIAQADRYISDWEGFTTENSDGVLKSFGAPLVGRISAFLEIWERTESGEVILKGERINFYDSSKDLNPPEVTLDFEAFGIRMEELRGEKVVINWKDWAAQVEGSRIELALDRFQRVRRSYFTKVTKKAPNGK